MSRIALGGFELDLTSEFVGGSQIGAPTRDTTSQRTGAGCLKCDSAAGNVASYMALMNPPSASTTYYFRSYHRFAALPATTTRIQGGSAAVIHSVRITPAGILQLWDNTGSETQIGSDSVTTLVTGRYYRVETMVVVNSSQAITDLELRLDGVTVTAASGLALAGAGGTIRVGWLTAPGANTVCYVDDAAINTTAGATNNTWCGEGKVVMLLPTADSAVGSGWTRGNGTAISGGNGFDSVNNLPPVGIADLGGAGADTGQLRNAGSFANSNYDATMQSYTAAGVSAGATINAIIPWTATAAPVVTSAKQGTVGVVSNPTITNIALGAGGTAGAFWKGSAGATYLTGWKLSPGTITETPSVTFGTAPVMRITQVTASTLIAMVCFMGMYVDYTPAAVIPDTGMAMTVT